MEYGDFREELSFWLGMYRQTASGVRAGTPSEDDWRKGLMKTAAAMKIPASLQGTHAATLLEGAIELGARGDVSRVTDIATLILFAQESLGA